MNPPFSMPLAEPHLRTLGETFRDPVDRGGLAALVAHSLADALAPRSTERRPPSGRRMLCFVLMSSALLPACAQRLGPDDAAPPSDDDDTSMDDDDSAPHHDAHRVDASVTGNGVIDPEGATVVANGDTVTFTLTPDDGHEPSGVDGTCGGTLVELEFTTEPVTRDCTVVARFDTVEPEPVPYCSDVPEGLEDVVACSPDINLDDWSGGTTFGINGLMIPRGRVLALPFTANATGMSGAVEITNNMPGLVATGLHWHGWFSGVPGGERVQDDPYCRGFATDPNPYRRRWNQSEPTQWQCHLGTEQRTLYFNMEVACIPKLESGCTPGERYDGDYWLNLSNIVD